MFTLSTFAFWIVRAQGLIYGYFNLFNIGRYPDVVFHGLFKRIFSYVVPIILVANVPARLITGHLDARRRAAHPRRCGAFRRWRLTRALLASSPCGATPAPAREGRSLRAQSPNTSWNPLRPGESH